MGRGGLFIANAVLDDDVDVLQQIDVAQHVAFNRDDVGVLAFAQRPVVLVDLHLHGRPIRGSTNRHHGIDAHAIDPRVHLLPRRGTMEIHRHAAVGANQHDDTAVLQLMELVLEGGAA